MQNPPCTPPSLDCSKASTSSLPPSSFQRLTGAHCASPTSPAYRHGRSWSSGERSKRGQPRSRSGSLFLSFFGAKRSKEALPAPPRSEPASEQGGRSKQKGRKSAGGGSARPSHEGAAERHTGLVPASSTSSFFLSCALKQLRGSQALNRGWAVVQW